MISAHIHGNEARENIEPARQSRQEPARLHEQTSVQLAAPQVVLRRAQVDRSGLTPADLLALQRTVGNRRAQRMLSKHVDNANDEQQGETTEENPESAVQTKLTVGTPNDVYEQEADRVAGQIMTMSDTATRQPVRREARPEDKEEVETKLLAGSITPWVQREALPEEVFFGEGKSPGNSELTAHELSHAVQQTGGVQRKQVFKQPTVKRECSACDKEEAEVQLSPNISAVSEPGIQRWSLFGDDEGEQESESSSSGGVLDWAKEKASGAINSVTQAGGDAYDWAKDKGSAAVDSVTQVGGDAYDWAKDKGGAVVDSITQAGGNAYDWAKDKGGAAVDWAKETGEEYSSALLEKKKSVLLAQISGAMQKVAGQEFVSLTDNQIATLNSHLAALREKSQGLINPPEIAGQADSTTAPGAKLVAASTLEALLLDLQSSLSAPFISPEPVSSASDSETVQGNIQRVAIALPAVAGISILGALAVLAIIGIIIAAIVLIVLMAEKLRKEKEKKEKEEKEKKEKEKKDAEEELAKKVAKCLAIHSAYKALGNCPSCKPTDTSAERAIKIACLTAVIAGRGDYLKERCDYVLPGSIARGSAIAERGHRIQLEQLMKMLAKCSTLPTS